ncbi:GIY-YIG nuclease family protein [Chitinophaga sancti]|uniref:GIY-YIG nuclease family protein n=1 Tax=Chitinophaga sancti TaxID=1004 RepID=UPI002A766153|nr:GIY-YIG nuclease family protein [Chitinophaga sancti]WPQ63419.1 GIY-YIG nuclease family protein [Chitinophaga sancti]
MPKSNDKISTIFDNDPFGLLNANAANNSERREDNRLIDSFEEISQFYSEHEREPDTRNIVEFQLKSRLDAIRSNPNKVRFLKKYDFYGLLAGAGVKDVGVNDILENDSLGILDEEDESDIFKLKFAKPSERIKPDYLSRRKACKDFDLYEGMFKTIHGDLKSGQRRLIEFNEKSLLPGRFFILNGVTFFLKTIDGKTEMNDFKSGGRNRFDGNTLCIFDNGTESDMLYRSLVKAMNLDGFMVSEPVKRVKNQVEEVNDIFNGYLYVLKSKSTNPHVSSIENLYKIGYTTNSVTQRINNAKNEATYLFSDVEVIATYRCLNIKTAAIENLIHVFFQAARLEVELNDIQGNLYIPKEWFSIPLKVIVTAIELIISNELEKYFFEPKIQEIVKRRLE